MTVQREAKEEEPEMWKSGVITASIKLWVGYVVIDFVVLRIISIG